MAILKHGSIKNTDYGEGQRYLLFEHDPETNKLLRDKNGNMILRKGLIQTGVKCPHLLDKYGILSNKWEQIMVKGVPNKQYTVEFKTKAIEAMLKEKLSYSGTVRRFEFNSHCRKCN